MEKYKVVLLNSNSTETTYSQLSGLLNTDKYFIFHEYVFSDRAVVILKLIDNGSIGFDIPKTPTRDTNNVS